jgi:hypothetical protein|tara:strand:- start:624 stop:890 length:267 start_codon:yes stop_codon:yes gene_type:complete
MSQSPETQYSGSQKKEWNTTFSTVKSWKVDDRNELVLSLITDNDTNEKKLFLNKQWTTKDGKKGNGKGATIPISIGNEVGMEIAKQCS